MKIQVENQTIQISRDEGELIIRALRRAAEDQRLCYTLNSNQRADRIDDLAACINLALHP
jgi:hypothetical protein